MRADQLLESSRVTRSSAFDERDLTCAVVFQSLQHVGGGTADENDDVGARAVDVFRGIDMRIVAAHACLVAV
jgi:hypothetical protein